MKTEMIEKAKELISGYCDKDLAEAAKEWLDKVDSIDEEELREKLSKAIENSVCSVDECLEFFKSPEAVAKFGKEKLEEFKTKMEALKEKGEKFCDCPACSKALELYKMIKEK